MGCSVIRPVATPHELSLWPESERFATVSNIAHLNDDLGGMGQAGMGEACPSGGQARQLGLNGVLRHWPVATPQDVELADSERR